VFELYSLDRLRSSTYIPTYTLRKVGETEGCWNNFHILRRTQKSNCQNRTRLVSFDSLFLPLLCKTNKNSMSMNAGEISKLKCVKSFCFNSPNTEVRWNRDRGVLKQLFMSEKKGCKLEKIHNLKQVLLKNKSKWQQSSY
jgi:hypothetical protein